MISVLEDSMLLDINEVAELQAAGRTGENARGFEMALTTDLPEAQRPR